MLRKWKDEGKVLVIFSSGSVRAQKLCFGYAESMEGDSLDSSNSEGKEKERMDLTPLISHYFDTINAGPKMEPASYEKIFEEVNKGGYEGWLKIEEILFLSDNINEGVAAKHAGMRAFVVVRKGNAPLSEAEKEGQVLISSLEEIRFVE